VTQRDKLLLTFAAIVGVLAVGWFIVIQPKRQDARELNGQITAARTELAGTAGRAAQYRAARDTLRKHPEAFARAGRALPNRVAMPDLLRTLTRTARSTGVEIGNLTTGSGGADASTPGIGTVGLQLSFSGKFLALQRYLAKLQHFVDVSQREVDAKGRLLALNSVALTPGDDGTLGAEVGASVYVLQPGGLAAGSAPAGTTGTTGTTAAPATPASTPTAGGVK
jgi:Tfp pilus assembly protein PilO